MAKPVQTHKQIKLLPDAGHPAGTPRIVIGCNEKGAIYGMAGSVVTLPIWEANCLLSGEEPIAELAKGGK